MKGAMEWWVGVVGRRGGDGDVVNCAKSPSHWTPPAVVGAVEDLGNRPIPVDSIPYRGEVCSIAENRISRGAFLLGGRPVPQNRRINIPKSQEVLDPALNRSNFIGSHSNPSKYQG